MYCTLTATHQVHGYVYVCMYVLCIPKTLNLYPPHPPHPPIPSSPPHSHRLVGSLPASWGSSKSLQLLSASHNQLAGNLGSLSPLQLPYLGFLRLDHNQLTGGWGGAGQGSGGRGKGLVGGAGVWWEGQGAGG